MSKTKNNYHKMLGLVFVVLVFAAVVCLLYLWQVSRIEISGFPTNLEHEKKITYANQDYGLQFEYSNRYQLDTSGAQPNYFSSGGKSIVSVSIPASAYPQTNFGSAKVTIAAKDESTQNECRTYMTGAGTTKRIGSTLKIESGTYYMDSFMGAAAGTAYRTEVYRVLQDKRCFEVNLTVGIASIGNFEQGSVEKVVEADVWNALYVILVNLKLNN
jgi:hypothetical protein